jgi:hypothetical protein
MKIMAIVDRHGLPLSVSTHAANHHEVRLVQLCFSRVFRYIKWYKLCCWCFVLPKQASDRPFATAFASGKLRVQGLNSATKRPGDTDELATTLGRRQSGPHLPPLRSDSRHFFTHRDFGSRLRLKSV